MIAIVTTVKTMAVLTAFPGKADALEALVLGMVEPCRREPGNRGWDVWRDEANRDRFIIDELYVDADAVAAHHETDHYQHYKAVVGDLATREVFMLSPLTAD